MLQAVSRTQHDRQREPRVKTLRSPLACGVVELNAALCLDTRAKK